MLPPSMPDVSAETVLAALRTPSAGDVGQVARIERLLAERHDARDALVTDRALDGFRILLDALQLRPGDEIILPAFTYPGVAHTIWAAGLTPVLADVSMPHFHMGVGEVERVLSRRTRAIVATHLFGMPCEMDALADLARQRGCFLLEDCAQGLGVRHRGRAAGSFGDAAIISFAHEKHLVAERGGAVVARDPGIAARIRRHASDMAVAPADEERDLLLALLLRIVFGSQSAHTGWLPDATWRALPSRHVMLRRALESCDTVDGISPAILAAAEPILKIELGYHRRWWNRLRRRIHARRPPDTPPPRRMNGLRAGLLLGQWGLLPRYAIERRSTLGRWREYLSHAHAPLPAPGAADAEISPLKCNVLVRDSAAGAAILREARRRGWPIVASQWSRGLHQRPRLQGRVCAAPAGLPVTERIAATILNLPLYNGLPDHAMKEMAELIGAHS